MSDDPIIRGRNAQTLFSDPIFNDILAEMELDSINKWKSSSDRDERERLHIEVSCLEGLRRKLQAIADNGVITEKRLNSGKQHRPGDCTQQ